MDSTPLDELTPHKEERNLRAAQRHRRELWWQILFPITLFLILLGFGIDYVLGADGASVAAMSQIGTMFLLLPLILIALLLFFLVIALIYLLAVVMQWLPPNAYWLQKQIKRLNYRVQDASDMAAEPFLRLDSWSEAASRLFKRFQ